LYSAESLVQQAAWFPRGIEIRHAMKTKSCNRAIVSPVFAFVLAIAVSIGSSSFAREAMAPAEENPAISSETPANTATDTVSPQPEQTTALEAEETFVPPGVDPSTLPHDLSPWGMFMQADIVVKLVMISLVFASILTWTVW